MAAWYPGQYVAMPHFEDDRCEEAEEALPQHPAGPMPEPAGPSDEERRKGRVKDDERLQRDPFGPGAR
jgi:hypothetical protein